jgi:MFS family permease
MAVTPLQANDLSRPRASEAGEISTDIPARLDRLPWSRFHVLVLVALGVTWILDGIEVTIVGAIGPVLQNQQTLGLSSTEIGGAASAYVVGAVLGAVLFGWLTDRFGRRTVFYVTLVVYLLGVLATATSWNFVTFALFRALTGFGIGGEYAAINSAIDELIPARLRGRTDIVVNGSFWLGAALDQAPLCSSLIQQSFRQTLGGAWVLRSAAFWASVSCSYDGMFQRVRAG